MGIELGHLSLFDSINRRNGRRVVQFKDVGGENGLDSGGKYRCLNLIGRLFRVGNSKVRNNTIRQELLLSLGRAFGYLKNDHARVVSQELVNRLKVRLGPGVLCSGSGKEFRLDEDGNVCSGAPLTERRITRIMDRVYEIKHEEENPGVLVENRSGKGLLQHIHDLKAEHEGIVHANSTLRVERDDSVLQNAFDITLQKFGADIKLADIKLSEKDHRRIRQNLDYAKNKMLSALANPNKKYEDFFFGLTLFNNLVEEIYRLGKVPYRELDAATFLKCISEIRDAELHPEKHPARQVDLKPSPPDPIFENFVVIAQSFENQPLRAYAADFVAAGLSSLENAKENGREGEPNAADIVWGAYACQDPRDCLLTYLTEEVAGMFVPVYGVSLQDGEREKIKQMLTTVLDKMRETEKSFQDEATLYGRISEAFGEMKLRGTMELDAKHAEVAVRNAVARLLVEFQDRLGNVRKQLANVGGGFKRAHTYGFKTTIGGREVKVESVFTPASAEINGGNESKRVNPLSNLGSSVLKPEGSDKPLVSFVRFGQVSVVQGKAPSRNPAKPRDYDVEATVSLAREILEVRPELREAPKEEDGKVMLPIYRIVMCGHREDLMPSVEGDVKFNDGGVDFKAMQIKFYVPMDSRGWKGLILNAGQVKNTHDRLEMLLKQAEKALKSGKIGEKEQAKIRLLTRSLAEYDKTVLNDLVTKNSGMDNADGKRGPELLRFGSQIAMLVSLLGFAPAINCNWGRDRTSAMDNEIKMLALRLEGEISPDDLKIAGSTLNDKAERTKLLFQAGNAYMAKRMDCSLHSINLNQSDGLSGLATMFGDLNEVESKVLALV